MTPLGTEATAAALPGDVGALIAAALADLGVEVVFGVISIHNMPIVDAIATQGRIRFVPARGEAGAISMADAYARVSERLGVVLTSTGTAAGFAAGGQAEALTAGTPLLHITSQVDLRFADRDKAPIHDVPKQRTMLEGISKAVFRIWEPAGALGTLTAAVSAALSAPAGPVSLEIPVDVQKAPVSGGVRVTRPAVLRPRADDDGIAEVARRLCGARRPMLWLGGGARGASAPATRLAEMGLGIVTSTQGRGVVAEDHPASLGAFNMTPEAEAIYAESDLMIVAGSRLRGNETRNNAMPLPPIVQIDANAGQGGRNYPVELFLHGDAEDTLTRLVAMLPGRLEVDPNFAGRIAAARSGAEAALLARLGPYATIAGVLSEQVRGGAHPWVRDVTISNSTFGNRFVQVAAPRLGVHALGGGIGQGIAMGIGAALASGGVKAITLLGDGGAMLGMAELITAVDEAAPLVYVLMNDSTYGVIQNIQDAQYQGRRHYSKLATPDFALLCAAVRLPHRRIDAVEDFAPALEQALAVRGPALIEVDMTAIGPFAQAFAGPPAGAAGKVR